MPRYIDADDLRYNVLHDNTYDNDTVNYYLGWIDDAPTADVVPVVRGEWIDDGFRTGLICSKCEEYPLTDSEGDPIDGFYPNFCPNCGANMRGAQ